MLKFATRSTDRRLEDTTQTQFDMGALSMRTKSEASEISKTDPH